MLGLVNHPKDICLSRVNESQAKFKSAVGRNLLQSWVNLTYSSSSISSSIRTCIILFNISSYVLSLALPTIDFLPYPRYIIDITF